MLLILYYDIVVLVSKIFMYSVLKRLNTHFKVYYTSDLVYSAYILCIQTSFYCKFHSEVYETLST